MALAWVVQQRLISQRWCLWCVLLPGPLLLVFITDTMQFSERCAIRRLCQGKQDRQCRNNWRRSTDGVCWTLVCTTANTSSLFFLWIFRGAIEDSTSAYHYLNLDNFVSLKVCHALPAKEPFTRCPLVRRSSHHNELCFEGRHSGTSMPFLTSYISHR